MRTRLIPAILAKDADDFRVKLKLFGRYFNLIQIDVMDGRFLNNETFYDLDEIRKMPTRAQYELHLMVERPEPIVEEWIGFEKTKRIIIHYETYQKRKIEIYDIIEKIKASGVEVGIAINPDTTVSKILEFLPKIDLLLVMGVTPGFSGQKFQEKVLEKIAAVRRHYPRLHIGVDGGVNMKNYRKIVRAGADILCSASMILKYRDKPEGIKELKKEISII